MKDETHLQLERLLELATLQAAAYWVSQDRLCLTWASCAMRAVAGSTL